jgi:hypothetical protein
MRRITAVMSRSMIGVEDWGVLVSVMRVAMGDTAGGETIERAGRGLIEATAAPAR